ncbi:MAG: hypothetical protein ACXVB9_08005 [Bdellovibrionota bacterium]
MQNVCAKARELFDAPGFVLAVLLLLGVGQAAGLTRQFQRGFRPFRAAPGRVAFSWDMFATRIERCSLTWDNPIFETNGAFFDLRQKSRTIEWQAIADSRGAYRNIAAWVCSRYHQPFHALLHCYLPDGKEETSAIECRL